MATSAEVRAATEVSIVQASADQPAHAADAVRLIVEYMDWVGAILRDTPQQIVASLNDPEKAVWLAYAGEVAVGCVAFRRIDSGGHAGEMKRLYVLDAYRGRGIAERLVRAAEQTAIEQGCTSIFLDSKDDLLAAVRLYERLGYQRCARYNDNPRATIFMRKDLPIPLMVRPFEPRDAEAFRLLNEAWISTLFKLEPKDRETLNDPIGKIIAHGGQIFMAVRGNFQVGCCAFIAMGHGEFELAKMAVAEQERGRGAGRLMLEHGMAEMRRQGARRLYLETNSNLHNAIHLYEAVGFRHLEAHEVTPSPYERADVFMEVLLQS